MNVRLLTKSSLVEDGAQQAEEAENEEAGAEERFLGGSRLPTDRESLLREAVGSWSQAGLRWETDHLQGRKHATHEVFVQLHRLSLQAHVVWRSSSNLNNNKVNSNRLIWITSLSFVACVFASSTSKLFSLIDQYYIVRSQMLFTLMKENWLHAVPGTNSAPPRNWLRHAFPNLAHNMITIFRHLFHRWLPWFFGLLSMVAVHEIVREVICISCLLA